MLDAIEDSTILDYGFRGRPSQPKTVQRQRSAGVRGGSWPRPVRFSGHAAGRSTPPLLSSLIPMATTGIFGIWKIYTKRIMMRLGGEMAYVGRGASEDDGTASRL